MTTYSRTTPSRFAAFAAAAALVSLGVTGTASATIATGPSGDAFYAPAASKYKTGKAGDVIWKRAANSANTLSNASQSITIVYKSKSLKNKLIPVSGTVWIPKGTPPSGGWPIVSWGHGTTGSADICAPSRFADPSGPNYIGYVLPTFDSWLAHGYAVAETDYEGMGTPGVHPWLIGQSEGRGIIDIVKAARKLDSGISTKWFSAGHSQGGHASLFAASLASTWGAGLDLRGEIAYAPANNMKSTVLFAAGALSAPSSISGLGALLARTTTLADPTIALSSIMTPEAYAKVGDLESRCISPATLADGTTPNPQSLGATTSFGQFSPQRLLKGWDPVRKSWTDANVIKALNALDGPAVNDSTLKIPAPVLILQGAIDGTVPAFTTQTLNRTLGTANGDVWTKTAGVWSTSCGNSCNVTYKEFPGVDHGPVVAAGLDDSLAFLAAHK